MGLREELIQEYEDLGINIERANYLIDKALKIRSKKTGAASCRIDAEWKPTENDRQFAYNLGFSAYELDEKIIPDFVDYWVSRADKGANKLDWSRTWKRWIRTLAEKRNGQRSNYKPTNETGMAEALARRREGGLFSPANCGKHFIDATATEIRGNGNPEFKAIGK